MLCQDICFFVKVQPQKHKRTLILKPYQKEKKKVAAELCG